MPTDDLARGVASSPVRLVLILIDTCYAGQGSGDIAKVVSGIKGLFSAESVGFFVIAAARSKEEAQQGVFAEALTSVLNDERLAGALQEFLLPAISLSLSTATFATGSSASSRWFMNPVCCTRLLPFFGIRGSRRRFQSAWTCKRRGASAAWRRAMSSHTGDREAGELSLALKPVGTSQAGPEFCVNLSAG